VTAGIITPELGEVLQEAANARALRMHVALPGTVLTYDAAKNLADIELQVDDAYDDDEDVLLTEPYPTLIGVPVVFPRAKNAFFAWAVEPGDRVAVMFASQAIDQWLATGARSAPADLRRHDLSHAFAVPGLYPITEPVAPADREAGGAVLGVPGGPQLRFTPTQIKLGKNATDRVALASLVEQAIKTAITGHTHSTPSGGGTSGSGVLPGTVASVGSQLVRSE
jgi:Phage protein Gp138 N-terminal domain